MTYGESQVAWNNGFGEVYWNSNRKIIGLLKSVLNLAWGNLLCTKTANGTLVTRWKKKSAE